MQLKYLLYVIVILNPACAVHDTRKNYEQEISTELVKSFYSSHQRDWIVKERSDKLRAYLSPNLLEKFAKLFKSVNKLNKNDDSLKLTLNFYNIDFFCGAFMPPETVKFINAKQHNKKVLVKLLLLWKKNSVAPNSREIVVEVETQTEEARISNVFFNYPHVSESLLNLLDERTDILQK